jgi:lipopolysaccharide export LptBFGC system permease protein LptF
MATLQIRDATLFLADGDKAGLAGDHSFPISGPVLQNHRPNHFVTLAEIRARIEDQRRIIREHRQQLATDVAASRDAHMWTIRYAQWDLNKLRTEVHSRYALACSCLCFAMFGCPLAAALARGKLMANLLFCFLPIVGIYYTIVFGMAGQCRNGVLDPAWAMWAGDAVLVGLAAWCFYRLASR